MIEDLMKNELFLRIFPPVAGLVFIGLFVTLGFWQLDRAGEKKALLAQFDQDAPYLDLTRGAGQPPPAAFARIEMQGRFDAGRQILIDNIPLEGRLGYYVITPFRPAVGNELLLVNRGWIPKPAPGGSRESLDVGDELRTVRGLAGHLPRVAIRPGEGFAVREGWPRIAVYPSIDEIVAELGAPLLSTVLLLDPESADGFVRRWQPNVSGPMTNYNYAFQWFAMAAAVTAILGWHLKKRLRRD